MAAAKLLALALIAAANSAGYAHKPQHLSVDYQIRLMPNDTSAFDVEVRIHNPPDTFQLAMAAHRNTTSASGATSKIQLSSERSLAPRS